MRLADLMQAAAEGRAICLACEAVQGRVAIPDEGCVECGDSAVYSAEFLLRAAQFVGAVLAEDDDD